MNQQWLIKHVLDGMAEAPDTPAGDARRYLSLDAAHGIVDETIDYSGRLGDDSEYADLTRQRTGFAHALSLIPFADASQASCLILGGGGYMALWISRNLGYEQVQGIEPKFGGKDVVTEREIRSGDDSILLKTHSFDISRQDWPLERHYDTVLCLGVLERLDSDPMGVMASIAGRMRLGARLVLSVPNAVSCRGLKGFLTGMPPWVDWFSDRDPSDVPRHCFEYTPILLKALLRAAGFEERAFRTITAYPDRESEADLIEIGEWLSLDRNLLGDTMIIQAIKVDEEVPLRYPDLIYSRDGFCRSAHPVLSPVFESVVANFREARERERRLTAQNQELHRQLNEALFTCDRYLDAMKAMTARESERVATRTRLDVKSLRDVPGRLIGAQKALFRRTLWFTKRLLTWGWWTLTLQLPAKLRERRRVQAMKQAGEDS